jgi:NADH:ubiquinone oxidoreductase subunit 4 (subunit M)
MLAAMVYVFWMLQRTLFGPDNSSVEFKDLNMREMIMLLPLVLMLLLTGIAPSLFTPMFEPQLSAYLQTVLNVLGGL